MKVINETLKGLNTFRGLGFVDFDNLLVPVCGQVMLDFGNGCEVRYIDQQIKRLKSPAQPVRAVVRGSLSLVEDPTESYCIFTSALGNYTLLPGDLEGIPKGLMNWETGKTQFVAPFRCRFPDTLMVQPTAGYQILYDQNVPAVNSSWFSEATAVFTTEVFIPGV